MEWGMDSMEWGMDSMEWWMDSMDFPDGFHTFSMEWGMDSTLFKDGFHATLYTPPPVLVDSWFIPKIPKES